jgi:uncharacterized OB-fold protein
VPYVIATVDLDAGARMVGRLAGAPAIGARVAHEFVDHDTWTELRFRPAAGLPGLWCALIAPDAAGSG